MSPAYARLEARFRKAALLGEASAILGWDHATMMPAGAAEGRAEQLAYLGRLRQDKARRRRACRGPGGGRGGGERPGRLAARQPGGDGARSSSPARRAGGPERGDHPGDLGLGVVLATGPCRRRFRRPAPASRNRHRPGARTLGDPERVAGPGSLRGPARLSRTRPSPGGSDGDLRRARGVPARSGRAGARPASRRGAGPTAQGRLPAGGAEGARRETHGGAGIRLRPWPAGREPPPLHRRLARRQPNHHPLRRGRSLAERHGRAA